MTIRGDADGGGRGVGGVVDGYGDNVSRAGGCVLGIGRPCNVASAFSAAHAVSIAGLQRAYARVSRTFLEISEFYCTRTDLTTSIVVNVRSERRALGEGESEVGIRNVRRYIRDEEQWLVQVWMWFWFTSWVCLRVICRHRCYRKRMLVLSVSSRSVFVVPVQAGI